MEKKRIFTSKFIAGVGILTAVEIVLYIIGAVVSFNGVCINLALIPIALGAILYGPICGAFLGFVNGVAVLLTPSQQAFFFDSNTLGNLCYLGTFLICFTKGTLAGLLSGYINRLFKNKIAGAIVGSLVIPVVNTTIFLAGAFAFYNAQVIIEQVLVVVFIYNFVIEFGSTVLLTPAVVRIIKIQQYRTNATSVKIEDKKSEEE